MGAQSTTGAGRGSRASRVCCRVGRRSSPKLKPKAESWLSRPRLQTSRLDRGSNGAPCLSVLRCNNRSAMSWGDRVDCVETRWGEFHRCSAIELNPPVGLSPAASKLPGLLDMPPELLE